MAKTKTKNYVNNTDLLEEIYLSIEKDELTRKCLDILMKLADRTQRKLYYSCEDDKQQCLSEAYLDIWKRWRKFEPFQVRSGGFELIEAGEIYKFYLDPTDRSSLVKCESLDDAELCLKNGDEYTYIKLNQLSIHIKDTKEGHAKNNPTLYANGPFGIPKLPSIVQIISNKINSGDIQFSDIESKVKVKYKKDGKFFETYAYKSNLVVKEPNPFSYFTSVCINGYAKGYKELKPNKDKGRFISLDSGFNNEDGSDLFNF